MQIAINLMSETMDWKTNFPKSFDEYFQNKPNAISYFDWLTHPLNPYKFTPTIKQILRIIEYKSRMKDFTFFFQETLAGMVGYSERWIRELLNRLTTIGILQSKMVHKNRQMQIIPRIKSLLFGQKAEPAMLMVDQINELLREVADEERQKSTQPRSQVVEKTPIQSKPLTGKFTGGTNTANSGNKSALISVDSKIFVAVTDCFQRSYLPTLPSLIIKQEDNERHTKINISGDSEQTIISLFEKYTGSKFIAKRDQKALGELSGYDKVIIEIGMIESAVRSAAKINTLSYMLGQVRAYYQATQANFITKQNQEKGTNLTCLSNEGLLTILQIRRNQWRKKQSTSKQQV